jgi:hypothetical protein
MARFLLSFYSRWPFPEVSLVHNEREETDESYGLRQVGMPLENHVLISQESPGNAIVAKTVNVAEVMPPYLAFRL